MNYALKVPVLPPATLQGGDARYACCHHVVAADERHAPTCTDEHRRAVIEAALARAKIPFERSVEMLPPPAVEGVGSSASTMDVPDFLRYMRAHNVVRCTRHYHAVDAMNVFEWAGAVAGEAGEAANVAKKIRAIDAGWRSPGESREALVEKLCDEYADTIIYTDLALAGLGRTMEDVVRAKFNRKSVEVGYPHSL